MIESNLIAGAGAGAIGSATPPGARAAFQSAGEDEGFRASLADAGLVVSGTPQTVGAEGRIAPGSWRLPIQQGPTAAAAMEGSTQRMQGGDGMMRLGRTAAGAATRGGRPVGSTAENRTAESDSGLAGMVPGSSSHSTSGNSLSGEYAASDEPGPQTVLQTAASGQPVASAGETVGAAEGESPAKTEGGRSAAPGELPPSPAAGVESRAEVAAVRVSSESRTTFGGTTGGPAAGRDAAALQGIPAEADPPLSAAGGQPPVSSPGTLSGSLAEGAPAAEGESGAGWGQTEVGITVQPGAGLRAEPAGAEGLPQPLPSAAQNGAEVHPLAATADRSSLPGPGAVGFGTGERVGQPAAGAGSSGAVDPQGAPAASPAGSLAASSAGSSVPIRQAVGTVDAMLLAAKEGVPTRAGTGTDGAAAGSTITGTAAAGTTVPSKTITSTTITGTTVPGTTAESSRPGLSAAAPALPRPLAWAPAKAEVVPATSGTGKTGPLPATLRHEAAGSADGSADGSAGGSAGASSGVPSLPPIVRAKAAASAGAAEEPQGTPSELVVPGLEVSGQPVAESVGGKLRVAPVQAGSEASGAVAPAAETSAPAGLAPTPAEATARVGRRHEAAVRHSVLPDAATSSLVSAVPGAAAGQTLAAAAPVAMPGVDATPSAASEAGVTVGPVSLNGRASAREASGGVKQGAGLQPALEAGQDGAVAGPGEVAAQGRSGGAGSGGKDAFAGVMEGHTAAAKVPAETVAASGGAALAGIAGAVQTGSPATPPATPQTPSQVLSQSSATGGPGHGSAGPQGVPEAAFPAHTTLVSTPTVLEVGVASGTNGWLKVRAEMNGEGAVAASVVASTASGADALHKDLPALSAYLRQESVGVSSLVVTRAESGAMTQQDAAMSFGSGAQGRQPGGETAGRDALADAAAAEAQGLPAAMPAGSLATGVASALTAGPGSGSGGWLNVVA